MLDITGARTQPPMRSHWKLRPGPQSYLLCNSKQLSKRYKRGKQHKQHSSHRNTSSREWAQTMKGQTGKAAGAGPGCRVTQGYLPHVNHATSRPSCSPVFARLCTHHRCKAPDTPQSPTLNRCPNIWYDGSCGAVGCKADLTSPTSPRVPPPSLGQR